jgi:hypothetical protein
VGKGPRLTSLALTAAWTVQSFASLVACLRTNVVLEALRFVFCRASDVPDPTIFFQLDDLLTTYNFTLQHEVCPINCPVGVQGRVRAALRRNVSLRRVESALRARGYRVEQRSLLPRAAERVGRMLALPSPAAASGPGRAGRWSRPRYDEVEGRKLIRVSELGFCARNLQPAGVLLVRYCR